ncbi:hypothetical protein LINPERHAP2_LOCUS7404 [Linum perenne]
MSKKIPQLWAKQGGVEVYDIGWGYYVVRFESIDDQDRAMFGGPWMVGDHYVVLQNWRPYFRPEDASLSTLRVWIRLLGLPIEYFDSTVLSTIGDKIGKTIRIDHTTLQGNRGNFARICVEVDISKPLVSKYRLRRRVRRIEYEGLHTICFSCGCYGHQQENCSVQKADVGVVAEGSSYVNPIFRPEVVSEDRPEVTEEFGPWMIVKRGRRRGGPMKNVAAQPVGNGSSPADSTKGNRFDVFNAEPEKESGEDSIQSVGGINSTVPNPQLEKEATDIQDPNFRTNNGQKMPSSNVPATGLSPSELGRPANGSNSGLPPTSRERGPTTFVSKAVEKAQYTGGLFKIKHPSKESGKAAEMESAHPSSTAWKKNLKGGIKSCTDGGKPKGEVYRQQGKATNVAVALPADMEVDATQLGDGAIPREQPGPMEMS